MTDESCKHCQNGWMGSDVECVNGVLIDIDIATEGWQRDVWYPPAPCQACPKCKGAECAACNDTGWRSGTNESQERLEAWARPVTPNLQAPT